MKKLITIIVLMCALCIAVSSYAETWTCPNCGKESEKNFCPWCGTKKPQDPIVCTNCGAEFNADTDYLYCDNCGTALPKPQSISGTAPSNLQPISGITNGSIFCYGRYEQDNDLDNGPEPIEWIVLSVEGDGALLVSRYALDVMPYHTILSDITWEQCSLRAWLNSEFLNSAFSAEEQEAILNTLLQNEADKNYEYGTFAGNDTEDRIFLLSEHDAFDLYFWSDDELMCTPTDYAMAKGAWILYEYEVNGRPATSWWIRSPGDEQSSAEFVMYDGRQNVLGVDTEDLCVRPAFWIDLNSGILVTMVDDGNVY